MVCRIIRVARSAFVSIAAITLSIACSAQATPTGTEIPDSLIDIYGGYGYFHPINSGINHYQYTDLSRPNATVSVTGYFNRFIGVQMEGSYFTGDRTPAAAAACSPACLPNTLKYYTAQAGPVLRVPLGRWIPYIHALGGGARYNGPVQQPLRWGWGVTGGAGLDYVLPFAHDMFAVRPIQADFQYSQVVYGPLQLPAGISGGFGEIDALKLSGGLVLRLSEAAEKHPPALGCTTQPASVFPGEPVTVHGSTLYLNAHKVPFFTWTSTGGRVMPNDADATIETGGLAPGEYTVTGRVREGKKGAERANCTAPFTVKPFEPPTISCSATPSSVIVGATVDISTVGTSPQNRPLTYSYSASAGQITSNGPTAQLSTEGVPAQAVTVTCNVVDDSGNSAKSTTQVVVNNPPPPAATAAPEPSHPLCGLSFTRDRARPVRVDNEAKGCLDDVALTLNQQSTATLVIIGNSSAKESTDAAAERALNIRQYLTKEKGIDSARIRVRVGDTSGRTARTILVPNGSTFDETNTHSFDENTIHHHGQAYGSPRVPFAAQAPAPVKPAAKPAPRSKPAPAKPTAPAKPKAAAPVQKAAPAAKPQASAVDSPKTSVPGKAQPKPANAQTAKASTQPSAKASAQPTAKQPPAATAKPAAQPTTSAHTTPKPGVPTAKPTKATAKLKPSTASKPQTDNPASSQPTGK